MQQLTDEERKKLCEWLRFTDEEHWWADNCGIAAAEIERLAKENVRLRKIIEDYDNQLVKYAAAN